jgi:SAM-dependent methyltransferase
MNIITGIMSKIVELAVHSPLYPYWLIFRVADEGNARLLSHARGAVLNVGSGADDKRDYIERLRPVQYYITLDYPGWDSNWKNAETQSKKFGIFSDLIFHPFTRKPTIWGDGYNLPLRTGSVDTVISQGVLEHVTSPETFMAEHYRVLGNTGMLLMTTPLLYESHGGHPQGSDDYWRLTEYGLRHLLSGVGFDEIEIQPYGNFGTALSQLINSYIIKNVLSWNVILLFCSLPILCFVFLVINAFCFIIDLAGKDPCYTAGFFIKASVKKSLKKIDNAKLEKILICPNCGHSLSRGEYCSACRVNFQNPDHGLVLMKTRLK